MNGKVKSMRIPGPDRGRRSLLAAGMSGAALSLAGTRAHAQEWPAKPIRLVLGYAPGGGADIIAREVSPSLSRLLGQPIVVDYKTGAGGVLAAAEVARAAPDGYTLGVIDVAPLTIIPNVRKLEYDPLGFTPFGMLAEVANVLIVRADFPANNLQELVEIAKKKPGGLSFGSSGVGSHPHLAGELLKSRANMYCVHIPYRGGAPAINGVLSGDVEFALLSFPSTINFIKSGRLKALAVTTAGRLPALPQVPTVAEQGLPGYEAIFWFAMMGPPGMPPRVVASIDKALSETLGNPQVSMRLEAIGSLVGPKTPLRQRIGKEMAGWKKLISDQKLEIEG